MNSIKRVTLLCFLIQVSIGLSHAQSKGSDEETIKPTDFEINSEENKIETGNGPFFFKMPKRNKPYKLPFIEAPSYDDFDQKSVWEVYNNEKTSKVVENDKEIGNGKIEAVEHVDVPETTLNESTATTIPEDRSTTPAGEISTPEGEITTSADEITPEISNNMENLIMEPPHQRTYIYFYKPFDSNNAPTPYSASEKDDKEDKIVLDDTAFSSLGFGYPFFDNIFSIPRGNIRIKATAPIVHQTPRIQEDGEIPDHGFSSLGLGYPFLNNLYSLPQEIPIKRAVAKVKIFAKGFDDGQIIEPQETLHTSNSIKDKKDSISKEEDTKSDRKIEDDSQISKDKEDKEGSANVEEILDSIMPFYNWATSGLFNMDMNRDMFNIGNIIRNNYGSSETSSDKKEEHSTPQHPPADILPDVEKDYENDTPEPRSFIEEVIDEINSSEGDRELNIERPPTGKDSPDVESEENESTKSKRQTPAKCVCGYSQGRTNSCSCIPNTFVYYQYCSVPVPPTD